MKSIELYAGAGGLAMGVSYAGFRHLAMLEWDRWACDTIRENQRCGMPLFANAPLFEGDVRNFDWKLIQEPVDVLTGGPPCQPFSMGGKHQANNDNRDMFPATVDIVRKLKPKAFILENVKGLTRAKFANYYQYVLLQLEFPEIALQENEKWFDHFLRLQKERASGKQKINALSYNVTATLVNAADYGVPQKRERVFIIGFRSDLEIEWNFPRPTHSLESLLYEQYVTGEYWERHAIAKHLRIGFSTGMQTRVKQLSTLFLPEHLPWRAVRDSIADLPDPQSQAATAILNHRFQDGAKTYPGHTGSPLDLPAKTLKAGDHGVPGGENMLINTDGSVRYFTVRESARLQTFPDSYHFHGSWTESMRQLGNAVPVVLARIVAQSVAEKLIEKELQNLVISTPIMKMMA